MSETQRWISNSQMRLALIVVEDLLGRNGQMAVLRLAGLERYVEQPPPDDDRMDVPRGDITEMFSGIVSMFGEQGARGVFRRWGRAYAERRLRRHVALRLLRPGLRLLPMERAASLALTRLLHHIDLARGEELPPIRDDGEYFFVTPDDCVYCFNQSPAQPNHMIVVGLIEGLLRWATGRDFDVGQDPSDPAVFTIRKRPTSRR